MSQQLIDEARATINYYHARHSHPSYEYTTGPKPEGDGWEINTAVPVGLNDPDNWRRRKVQAALVQP